jgi:hypothetical protein
MRVRAALIARVELALLLLLLLEAGDFFHVGHA